MKQVFLSSWFHVQRALRAAVEFVLLFLVPRRLSAKRPVTFRCRPPFRTTVETVLDRQGRAGLENASIRSARALLFGVGAIGSKVALLLAQMGFGEIELIDMDSIARSNVARGFLLKNSIGELKVVATGRELARGTASGSTIRAWRNRFQNVVPHIERQGRVTLIMALLDNDGSREDAALLARQWQAPLIVTGLDAVSGGSGYVLYWDPGQHRGGCAQCFVGSQPPVVPAEPSTADAAADPPTMTPCAASRADVVALVAARAAWFAVSIAEGKLPAHRLERIFQNGRIEQIEDVERVTSCVVCGAAAGQANAPVFTPGARQPDSPPTSSAARSAPGGGFSVL